MNINGAADMGGMVVVTDGDAKPDIQYVDHISLVRRTSPTGLYVGQRAILNFCIPFEYRVLLLLILRNLLKVCLLL